MGQKKTDRWLGKVELSFKFPQKMAENHWVAGVKWDPYTYRAHLQLDGEFGNLIHKFIPTGRPSWVCFFGWLDVFLDFRTD